MSLGRTLKVRIAIPEVGIKKSNDFHSATLSERAKVYLEPSDNYSLRCVQSIAACPNLLVHMPFDAGLRIVFEILKNILF